MKKLSVVIPAYNEEKRICKTLAHVFNYLSHKDYKHEIIVVNDASSDDTLKKIRTYNFQKLGTKLVIINHKHNQGKGAAVKNGILASTGDYILFMDADNSTKINEIDKILPYIKSHEVVIGSRYLKKNSIKLKQPLTRRIISRVGNIFIKLLLKINYADTQCGFKLFQSKPAKKIFNKVTIDRWGFDIELLVIAEKLKYKIVEVAVNWYDSPQSQLRSGRDTIKTFNELIKIKKNLSAGIYN